MIKLFQKYTILGDDGWKILLPVGLMVSSRSIFLFFYENDYQSFSLISDLFFPFLYDALFYLVGVLLFFTKTIRRYYIVGFCFWLFLSNLIYFHHFKIYFLPPGTGAIAALFETTPLEALEFTKITTMTNLISTLLLSSVPFLGLIGLKKIKITNSRILNSTILFVLIGVSVQLSHYMSLISFDKKPIDNSHIFRDLKNVLHYADEFITLQSLRSDRMNATFNAKQNGLINSKPQTHVLILGESLSRNHMSVYGYPRKTTPRMDSSKTITFFNNVISPTTQTRSSILRMLTTAFGMSTQKFYSEGSITTAMKDAGFKTYWISNQGRYGISDTETSALADDSDETFFVNTDWKSKSLDEKVIGPLQTILERNEKHQFIIIHLLGSHFDYIKRVPDGFEFIFSITEAENYLSEEEKIKVDQYDATVLYTDIVVDSIKNMLSQNRRYSTMLFVSDHGEDIYDDRRKLLGHGSPIVSKYTVEIPFFVWQSNNYQSLRGLQIDSSMMTKFYNAGNLFYSLVDLYQVEFENLNKERSIFNNQRENYPYIINSNNEKINYYNLK